MKRLRPALPLAWLLLAAVAVGVWAWTARYAYYGCDGYGCVVVDRWTHTPSFVPVR